MNRETAKKALDVLAFIRDECMAHNDPVKDKWCEPLVTFSNDSVGGRASSVFWRSHHVHFGSLVGGTLYEWIDELHAAVVGEA